MKRFVFIFAILLILGFLVSFLIVYFDFHRKREIKEKIYFEIEKGESLKSISERLEKLGLVNGLVFYLFSHGKYKNFKAGEYVFEGFISPADIVNIFQKGPTHVRSITVLPCWTIYHIASELVREHIIEDEEEFIRYSLDRDFLRSIGIDLPSAEGFLYPDTYYFFKGTDVRDIIAKMVENFFLKVGRERIEKANRGKLGFYKVLILASIVEAEATFEFEKPIIASVFLNRLRKRMRLQADPTVMYGLRIFDRPPRPSDLKIDNEYNTYTRFGLPPTPICNPLVSSIDAVLKPKKTDYLYFVAKPDMTHLFARTYKEHLRNIQIVKKMRKNLESDLTYKSELTYGSPLTKD